MGGSEGLAELANLEKRNWLLEERVGGDSEAATLILVYGAAPRAPCNSLRDIGTALQTIASLLGSPS